MPQVLAQTAVPHTPTPPSVLQLQADIVQKLLDEGLLLPAAQNGQNVCQKCLQPNIGGRKQLLNK